MEDGTYVENIDFHGKAITVRSENGPNNSVIDGGANGSVVTFATGEGLGSILKGFSITNGSVVNGGGIYCDGSSPSIADCIISQNTATGNGGGIYCSAGSSASFINLVMAGNTATDGGGIYCEGSSPVVTDCTITANTASNSGGGIACSVDSSPEVTNTILWVDIPD